MGRLTWRETVEIEVSRLLLTDRDVAVFLVAGNDLMVVKAGSLRCNVMVNRGDTTASVLVGYYQTITAQFDDVMSDVDAARRRRDSVSSMRRRGKRRREAKKQEAA